ncbi:MAG: hypothetical protein KGJ13_02185 [Patescibacteria group bacterium]|nr:hypothetical protein [Patescibacteria group bacterium]
MRRVLFIMFVISGICSAQIYSVPPYYMETHQTQDSLLYQQPDDSAATAPTVTQLPYNWCWCWWRPANTPYMFVCWKDTNGIQYDTVRKLSSLPPSGTAGGDLTGTYPNPTVAKINGVTLGTTTAASGNVLIGSGTQWVSHAIGGDAVMDASGSITNAKMQNIKWKSGTPTTGQIPVYDTAAANTQWTARTLAGDVSVNDTGYVNLSATGVGAATYGDATHVPQIHVDVKGRITSASNVAITGSGITQIYAVAPVQVNGTDTVALTNGTNAQILVDSQAVKWKSVSVSGDVGLANTGVATVTGWKTVSLNSTTATAGHLMIASNSTWTSEAMSGDVTMDSTGKTTWSASYTKSYFAGGLSSTLAANVTKFYPLNGQSPGSGTDSSGSDFRTTMADAGTMAAVYVTARNAPGAGQTYTLTLYKNGSATTMTVQLAGASQVTGSDVTHTQTYAAGDEFTWKIVSSATAQTLRGINYTIRTTP